MAASISLIKLLGMIKAPATWLYMLVVDQTRIEISGQDPSTPQPGSLYVSDSHAGEGSLLFGITTTSRQPIQILKVAIEYSAPLQLLDPNKMGFFQTKGSDDEDLPFCIYFEGDIQLHSKLTQAFALTAQFPPGIRELPVRISVHALKRSSSYGGFESFGRTQITSKFLRIILTDKKLLGLAVLPKHNLTSPQPFLIQSAIYASGEAGSALVHEQNNDGIVSSRIVEWPVNQQRAPASTDKDQTP